MDNGNFVANTKRMQVVSERYQDGDKINKEIVDCFSPSSRERDLFPQKQNTSRANTEH